MNWTSHSHGIQLEGSARGRLANLRSLSLADETKIPGPAVPVWRDQLKSLLFPIGISVFERMRLLEHDDRQISLPTPKNVVFQTEFVTYFFKSHEAIAGRVSCVAARLSKCVSVALQSSDNACRMRCRYESRIFRQAVDITGNSG